MIISSIFHKQQPLAVPDDFMSDISDAIKIFKENYPEILRTLPTADTTHGQELEKHGLNFGFIEPGSQEHGKRQSRESLKKENDIIAASEVVVAYLGSGLINRI